MSNTFLGFSRKTLASALLAPPASKPRHLPFDSPVAPNYRSSRLSGLGMGIDADTKETACIA